VYQVELGTSEYVATVTNTAAAAVARTAFTIVKVTDPKLQDWHQVHQLSLLLLLDLEHSNV
jgi:hypothetical protein